MDDKYQITNSKIETSIKLESQNNKPVFDLEERTLQFAKDVRSFVRLILKDVANNEDIKQLVRSSGSVGANYIEANEALSKKDFALRIKISRKEAKESTFWLKLLLVSNNLEAERVRLTKESVELMKILSAILRSTES
jgi:four helix bundle protein